MTPTDSEEAIISRKKNIINIIAGVAVLTAGLGIYKVSQHISTSNERGLRYGAMFKKVEEKVDTNKDNIYQNEEIVSLLRKIGYDNVKFSENIPVFLGDRSSENLSQVDNRGHHIHILLGRKDLERLANE